MVLIYTTIGELSSKSEVLAVRSQCDSVHGDDFPARYMLPICDVCATAFSVLLSVVFYGIF